jgi:hypothetical protein
LLGWKQDQLRARHRLSKFLLRSGQRPAPGVKAWTQPYLVWVRQLRFKQVAQESTRLDDLHEVEHTGERVKRLEQAIAEAVKLASPALQEVVKDLQALRGIAQISAVTIASELGEENPRMLYATGSAGLATLVRGSSPRIKIMRSRPANIRLINRRPNLPRLLPALSSEKGNDKNNDNDKNNPTDAQRLTGSLHIRATVVAMVTYVDVLLES